MIQAEDLRIGNYIYQDGECCGIFARQLFEFSEYLEYGAKDEIYKYWEPIPLTDEWLVKLGFVYDVGWEKHNFDLRKFGDEIGYRDQGLTLNGLGTEIIYVHQLQNLYYTLTGTELTTEG